LVALGLVPGELAGPLGAVDAVDLAGEGRQALVEHLHLQLEITQLQRVGDPAHHGLHATNGAVASAAGLSTTHYPNPISLPPPTSASAFRASAPIRIASLCCSCAVSDASSSWLRVTCCSIVVRSRCRRAKSMLPELSRGVVGTI